ncbi:MAG: glycosyltransferase family 2 protein [Planctomycetota bacterium]
MPIYCSVIIPAHNEAACLPDLLSELQTVLDLLPGESEIVIVDDGSTDETPAILEHWSIREPRLRWFRMNGNFGQSAAFDAGFRAARGEVLITMDADGQNPPQEIPKLLAALDGCDVVCGWRYGRQDHWTKHLASKFANTLRRWVLQDGIHDTGCSLKAFRREAVARIKLFHGLHRFLPALVQMEGFEVQEIRVAHRPRQGGSSHYGILNRMLGPLVDLLAVRWMKQRSRKWRVSAAQPKPQNAQRLDARR